MLAASCIHKHPSRADNTCVYACVCMYALACACTGHADGPQYASWIDSKC